MNKIKALRMKCKMTQEELAVKSGVSRTTIWALESGKQEVTTTATLKKIATALNTSVSEIFFDD